MSNTINWGKIYEKTAWGIGVVTNTISWGKIYANLAGSIPSFALDFANIANDFTFTRSSFATRVNEFGLIETVTDLGSDLVTNGTFDTDLSGWSIQGGNTNWVWDNGTATMNGGVESGLTQAIGDNTTLYQVTIEVVTLNGSSLRVLDASSGNVFLSEGINTIQTTLLGGVLYIKPSAIVGDIVIDNVSVKEVLEDDVPRIDYSGSTFDVPVLGDELIDYSAIGVATGGWSLVNGKWFFDDITAGHLETESFYAVVGEQYEVTVDVSIESGNANFRFTSGNSQTILFNYIDFPNGVTKFITTVSGVDGFINRLFASQNPTDNPFTLNSISVKKVTAYTTTDKGSFLLEPQSTNLLPYSEDFSNSDWFKLGNSAFGFVTGVAPDGNTSVYEITSDGTGGKLQYAISGLSINTEYTLSFYAKQTSPTTLVRSRVLSLTGGSGGSNLTEVDYQDQLVTDEWVRITHTFTTDDTLGDYIVYVSNNLTSGESLQFWGAQLEALPYATSYIPTNGSTVTRSAESCVKDNLSTDGIFGGKEGTILLHVTDMAVVLTSLNNLTPFRVYRQSGDNYRFYYETDASFIGGLIDLSNNGGELKMAFSISETDINLYVNGSLHASYTYVNPMPSDLESWVWATETKYKERVKDFKIYDKALTDEELIKLTTI